MKKTKLVQHQWTKQELKELLRLWDTMDSNELAAKFNVNRMQLGYIAGQMRKAGFKLAHKRVKGHLRSLLEELRREMR